MNLANPSAIIGLIISALILMFSHAHGVTLTYTYDNLNRLTKVVYGDGTTEEFSYDAAGNRLTQVVTLSGSDATPPQPNPMTWATVPYGTSSAAISMVATAATDSSSPPVSYYFSFVDSPTGGTGGVDSAWQSGASYSNSSLQSNHHYGYRVKARDSASTPNETSYSSTVYIYTFANSPVNASFSNMTETSIRGNWLTNGNRSGTEYFCENMTKGTNSGWTINAYWDSTGLTCGTSYSFRVKGRNGDGIETGWTSLGSQGTQSCPVDTTPPTPNPMTWASAPSAVSSTAISMTATAATDVDSPPVSYYFNFVDSPTGGTGGVDSAWQSGTTYTNSGLQPNHQYGYRVKARDSAPTPNETSYSSTVYRYTLANVPGTASFSGVTQTGIRANWAASENRTGTEYFCENTTKGTNSGWTTNTYWDSTGLTCGTLYSFRVKARNGDSIETGWTSLGSQLTGNCNQSFPFTDDFSTNKGWTGYETGGWERRPAVTGGGENGNADPGTDHTATSDNYILGFAIGGDYPNSMLEKSVISPPVNCTGQSRVFLKYWRYLNVESNQYDHTRVSVSSDGTTWTQVWENPVFDLTDHQWRQVVYDISGVVANQGAVYVKFTMGPTNSTRRYSGWNIDDVEMTSSYTGPLALYVPSADTPNPNIDELLVEAGLGIQHSGTVPSHLSDYDLVILSKEEASNPTAADAIKSFIQNGGGALIMGGTPKPLAGNTDDLTSIRDWLGGGTYGKDCGYGVVALDHPFGTALMSNNKVDYLPTSPCAGDSISNLDPDATLTSRWSSGSKAHSFQHPFGTGRVFYYGGEPGYSEDPDPLIIDNGLALYEAGLTWIYGIPTIGYSPGSFSFSAIRGGSNPSSQTLNITNSGGGTLSWTVSDNATWLSASPTSGTNSGSVSVSINISGLSGSTYNGTITITSPGATNSPVNIPVTLTLTASQSDLIETSVSNPPSSATVGGSFPVTDTAKNQGTGSSKASYTRFYLSWDTNKGSGDVLLTGSRSVPGLAAGATSTGTVNVTIPSSTTLGTYYLLACADDTGVVVESIEGNNCIAASTTVQVSAPDLMETSVSNPPATALSGSRFSVTDTVENQGSSNAGNSSTRYYLSLDTVKGAGDVLLTGSRPVAALAPGATSTGTVNAVIPSSAPVGTYYLLACTDDTGLVAESNEGNNCIASSAGVQVISVDLIETSVSNPPGTASLGSSLSVTDTAKNQGSSNAGASTTRYYLSVDTAKGAGDVLLTGSRPVAALVSGGSSTGTVNVVIPSTAGAGTYYLLACADDMRVVAENDDNNNCMASSTTVQVTVVDLIETSVSNPPGAALLGSSFSVTDTAKNQGSSSAGASTSRYYLSVDTTKSNDDKLLTGSRSVPGLAGEESSTGTVSVTITSGTASGTYYLIACADDLRTVPESNENNNCIASGTTVQVQAPDLIETAVSNPPATAKVGSGFSVTDTVKNQGNGDGGASTTRYYLSVDMVKGAGDRPLTGSRSVPALGTGITSTGTLNVTIPSSMPLGTYYLLACADDGRVVAESNENNNCIASSTTVQVTP